ncbi:HD domain-containing protein [Candidatus Peregrinibacteria bacterium]|jgi:hypothetical protein|nr:HD domain-containing protein [Candidatus Peregrinibacteria bacterium]
MDAVCFDKYEDALRDISPNAVNIVSPELRQAILDADGVKDEGHLVMDDRKLDDLIELNLKWMSDLYDDPAHPYHNIPHTREVVENTKKLLALYEDEDGNPLPKHISQVVILAALFHDLEHCGKTIKQAESGLSNEQHAVLTADGILEAYGFSVWQRVLFQGLIIGTSFDDRTNEELPEGMRPSDKPKPETRLEEIVAIADLAAGALSEDLEEFMGKTAAVFAEKDNSKKPTSVQDWLNKMCGFWGYLRSRFTPEAEQVWGGIADTRGAVLTLLKDDEGARKAPEHAEFMRLVHEKIVPVLAA